MSARYLSAHHPAGLSGYGSKEVAHEGGEVVHKEVEVAHEGKGGTGRGEGRAGSASRRGGWRSGKTAPTRIEGSTIQAMEHEALVSGVTHLQPPCCNKRGIVNQLVGLAIVVVSAAICCGGE